MPTIRDFEQAKCSTWGVIRGGRIFNWDQMIKYSEGILVASDWQFYGNNFLKGRIFSYFCHKTDIEFDIEFSKWLGVNLNNWSGIFVRYPYFVLNINMLLSSIIFPYANRTCSIFGLKIDPYGDSDAVLARTRILSKYCIETTKCVHNEPNRLPRSSWILS